jgi:hypothetical protein
VQNVVIVSPRGEGDSSLVPLIRSLFPECEVHLVCSAAEASLRTACGDTLVTGVSVQS